MSGILELRTYRLKTGTGPSFHRLVVEDSIRMLERCGVEVVAFGPSLDDAAGAAYESGLGRPER